MLIITSSIDKKEFQPFKNIFSLDILKRAAVQSLSGIGIDLKSSKKISNTKLKKIDITSPGGAGRVIFLLEMNNYDIFLVMIRHKNDKKIGSNMTMKNKFFYQELEKNLDLILHDLKKDDYVEHNLTL
jgi:hypothetical protein